MSTTEYLQQTADKPNEPEKEESHDIPRRPIWLRVALFVGVIGVSAFAMNFLLNMRQEPPAQTPSEAVAKVMGVKVTRQDVPTMLSGYGTARAHRRTEIAPEVSGRIVYVHPNLEEGRVVPEDEILIRIDPENYRLALLRAEAEATRLESELAQTRMQLEKDQRRLDIQRNAVELAEADYQRTLELFRDGGAESQAALDRARLAVNREESSLALLEKELALYPSRIKSLEASVKSAQASLEEAELNLARTEIRAPFAGRIASKMVELGQRVAPGSPLVVVADDSQLEIPVSLDSREVSRWLNVVPDPNNPAWFMPVADRPVQVMWTERRGQAVFTGRLDRAESFDITSRTFRLVVTVDAKSNGNGDEDFPLTDGMFCEVDIPGRVAEDVIPVPRAAVESGGKLYISDEDSRLRTRYVDVVRLQDDVALVSQGIEDGTIVLTTRPPEIIDGMKLQVAMAAGNGAVEVSDE